MFCAYLSQGDTPFNLNTHKKVSLYEVFEAEEARRIANKSELHYTPKHGSWLDIAEIQLNHLNTANHNKGDKNHAAARR